MRVHLLDGTYELFRHYFAVPKHRTPSGQEVGAIRGALRSVLSMFEDGVTHLGVATDHVVESFRNELWPGYKSSEGMDPDLLSQFLPLERALEAMGVKVLAMTELEADDALGAAAKVAAEDPRVEQVLIATPDKDLAQCVSGRRVVQFDRRKRELRDEEGVVAKFGVRPESIPDYLALTGDSSDGFPGLHGWGPKSASVVLARFGHIEEIPDRAREWGIALRGAETLAATLRENRDRALLFKDLATLRCDAPVIASVDELEWTGPTPAFSDLCASLDASELSQRASAAGKRVP